MNNKQWEFIVEQPNPVDVVYKVENYNTPRILNQAVGRWLLTLFSIQNILKCLFL